MGTVSGKVKELLPLKFSKSVKFDPDDKWSNLYREREKNHLYKWVGLYEGGELSEAYDSEGEEGVIKFAHDKISPLLYNEGLKAETIKFNDYVRWKKTLSSNLGGGDEYLQLEDEDKFQEHTALWRLNKRGVEGETATHLLLNRGDPKSTEIAKILIREYPGLALDIYEGTEMFGQSLLHLAIVHDDYDMVCILLEAGTAINSRATGKFFLPEDQKLSTGKKQTNYVGYAYYGEYPLGFSACFCNKDIYDVLIQYGADPNLQDSFGNTVLHICVINNSIAMYSYAVRHWAKPADVNILNNAGYTPLTLAGQLGRKDIFEEMLELMKVIRYAAEIIVILNCLLFVVQQQGAEIRRQGLYGFTKNLGNAPAKSIFLIANIFILLCIPCRLFRLYDVEEALLVFALPGSWLFLLFFARGAPLTGPFVQMIYSMIAGDIARFAIISAIFLVSFSQAFYFVGKDMRRKQETNECSVDHAVFAYSTFADTFVTLFRASMGGYDFLTKMIFLFYMIIMPIMLINMLIAMMGNTYTSVISQAEKAWRQQWAQIVMVLERSINKEKLARYQLDYSIKLSDAGNDGMESRGLMVIKQTRKTRARQRKHAVSNWKRLGRRVIKSVSNYGSQKTKAVLHSHSRVRTPLLAGSSLSDYAQNKLAEVALGTSLYPGPSVSVHRGQSRLSTEAEPDDKEIATVVNDVDISAPASFESDAAQLSKSSPPPAPRSTTNGEKMKKPKRFSPFSLKEFGRRPTAQALPNIPEPDSSGTAVPLVRVDTFSSKSSSKASRSHSKE